MNALPRILVGYTVLYIAFDGAGRLLDGLGLGTGKIAAAAVGVAMAVAVEVLLHGRRSLPAVLLTLGWGKPDMTVVSISVAVSAALLASMPVIFRLAGAELVLPDTWPVLALSIWLLNGLAEETIYRGYLFRRLRAGHSFGRAVLLGTALAAAAHLTIILSAGIVVGLLAVVVSVLTFLPFATLFERGRNTIWAPAVLHGAADCIIPLGALGLAPPMAIVYWMGAQVAACAIAVVLVRGHNKPVAVAAPGPWHVAIVAGRVRGRA
jgi:membrane protease YdiL (CAAX protease family)